MATRTTRLAVVACWLSCLTSRNALVGAVEDVAAMNQSRKQPFDPLDRTILTDSNSHLLLQTSRAPWPDHSHIQQQQQEQQDSIPNEKANAVFCRGMYMGMFMDGFHFSLGRPTNNPPPCLNFMVRSWRLSDRGRFIGAMVFSFLFALLTEGLSAVRGVIVRYGKGQRGHRVLLNLVYALQSAAGYLLMFTAMSFSIELLLSVVAGLMVGNRFFLRHDDLGQAVVQQRAAQRRGILRGLQQPLLSEEDQQHQQ